MGQKLIDTFHKCFSAVSCNLWPVDYWRSVRHQITVTALFICQTEQAAKQKSIGKETNNSSSNISINEIKKRVRKANGGEVRNKKPKFMAVINHYLTANANHSGNTMEVVL